MNNNRWSPQSIPDLSGRRAIITGGNSGLGFEIAKMLAGRGASIVLACRSVDRARVAQHALLTELPRAEIAFRILDLTDLKSVHAFAESSLALYSNIDLLINNAGVMAIPRSVSVDGFELQLATNHLGHFALTGLLLPRLLQSRGSRIVSISSLAARRGKIAFADLMGERDYDDWRAYCQSKLANLMFGLELHRRLVAARASTSSVVAHPGVSRTGLFSTPGDSLAKRAGKTLAHRLFQSAASGAEPVVFAATASRALPGEYYGPAGIGEFRGGPARALVPELARDDVLLRRLWEVSETLTGVRYL